MIFIGDGLMSGGQIDDTKAAHTNAARAIHVNPLIVWAAVQNGFAHGVHNVFPGLTIFKDVSRYAAHRSARLLKEANLTIFQLSQSSIHAAQA